VVRKIVGLVVLAVLCAAGCVQSNSITCDGGYLCPAGLACDEAHHACVRQAQLTACNGLADEATCAIDEPDDGICSDGVCLPSKCGDGVIAGAEQCDGDAFVDAKFRSCKAGFGFHDEGVVTCSPQCTYKLDACTRSCGDGTLDLEEVCDGSSLGQYSDCRELGFYDQGALTCTGACTYDTTSCERRCGDHIKDPEELCDGAPPALGCTDFGYDAGFAPCAPICAADLGDCKLFGWKRLPMPYNSYLASVTRYGDTLYAGLLEGQLMTYKAGGSPSVMLADTVNSDDLDDLWVFSPTDVWAATIDGLLHYNGAIWTRHDFNISNDHAFWGFAPNNIYLFGAGKTFHWNGSAWSEDTSVPVLGYAYDAYATATNNVFVMSNADLRHFNGLTWGTKSIPGFTRYLEAGGIGSTIFIGGGDTNGHTTVARSQNAGTSWTVYDLTALTPNAGIGNTLTSIFVNEVDDVWVSATNALYHFDGVAWTVQSLPTRTDVVAAIGNEVIAGGFDYYTQFGQTYRYLGTSLVDLSQITPTEYELAPYSPLTAGSASASDNLWIGTSYAAPGSAVPATTFHFDGTGWTEHTTSIGTSVSGLAAFSPTNVYAALRSTGIYHYNGTGAIGNQWTLDGNSNSIQDPLGIWGTDDTHLWAVESFRVWQRGSGGTWTMVLDSALGDGLLAIGGRSPTDIWAVGESITYHYDGAWKVVGEGINFSGNAVWTAPGADVFVVANGVIRRFDGVTWTPYFTGVIMKSIWGTAQNDVFAVGENSTVLHFDGTNWSPVRVETTTVLNAVFGVGQTTLFVGGAAGTNGVVRQLNRTQPW
jgi:hypothetical protein